MQGFFVHILMETVFVTIATFGSYEDREKVLIYVGSNYELANARGLNYEFRNPDNNYVYIERWVNGKLENHEMIIG